MDDLTHEPSLKEEDPLPSLSDAERDFWRRAVAVERARQNCGGPVPFPFHGY